MVSSKPSNAGATFDVNCGNRPTCPSSPSFPVYQFVLQCAPRKVSSKYALDGWRAQVESRRMSQQFGRPLALFMKGLDAHMLRKICVSSRSIASHLAPVRPPGQVMYGGGTTAGPGGTGGSGVGGGGGGFGGGGGGFGGVGGEGEGGCGLGGWGAGLGGGGVGGGVGGAGGGLGVGGGGGGGGGLGGGGGGMYVMRATSFVKYWPEGKGSGGDGGCGFLFRCLRVLLVSVLSLAGSAGASDSITGDTASRIRTLVAQHITVRNMQQQRQRHDDASSGGLMMPPY